MLGQLYSARPACNGGILDVCTSYPYMSIPLTSGFLKNFSILVSCLQVSAGALREMPTALPLPNDFSALRKAASSCCLRLMMVHRQTESY